MSLRQVAGETLLILERGSYRGAGGQDVEVAALRDEAIKGTALYRPDDFEALGVAQDLRAGLADPRPPKIEVTGETTAVAARRLVVEECLAGVAALDFASAKHPGGGFLGGAKAQEEDLARCSALYPCQLTQSDYYSANRAQGSMNRAGIPGGSTP